MRILFKGINRPQSIAKKFSQLFDYTLSDSKEKIAKYSGYRNWKELKQVSLLNNENTWLTNIYDIKEKWFELISTIFYDNYEKNIWHPYIFDFIVKSGWVSSSFELTTFPHSPDHNPPLRCAMIGDGQFIVCNPYIKLFEACYYIINEHDNIIKELYSIGHGNIIQCEKEKAIYLYHKNEDSFTKKISHPSIPENYQLPWDILWIPNARDLNIKMLNCDHLILSGYEKATLPEMKSTTSLILIDCPGLEEINVPENVVELIIRNCNNLKKININHVMNLLNIEYCKNLEQMSENAEIWKVIIDSTNKKFISPENIFSAYCYFPSDISSRKVEIGQIVKKVSFGNKLFFSDNIKSRLIFDDEPGHRVKRSNLIMGNFLPFSRKNKKIEKYECCKFSNNIEWKKL